jgi:glutathione synthase/RimK-type ligase-like ATP-grasp enzyme
VILIGGFPRLKTDAIDSAVFKERRFDFRVYVMFGKVVYLYAKSSPVESYVTNWSQGGRIDKKKKILKALPKEKVTRIKKLAKRAARALGLNFAGIDIICSQDLKSAYVLEGNAFPGYEKGFDLMKCLLNRIIK